MSCRETRMRKSTRALLVLSGLLLAATWSAAAPAYTARLVANARLRAGPSTEYPIVATLPVGAAVEVFGCEVNYGWCDAQRGPDRGWVDAVFLQMPSANGPVIIASGGVALGIPIVTFSFGSYWD